MEVARFACKNNPNDKPLALHETGIMVFLPVLDRYGRHPITPRTSPKTIRRVLSSFIRKGKVLPGIHPVMEMEHIVTLNKDRKNRDLLQEDYGDWGRINKQFSSVSELSSQVDFVGAGEAVLRWLEYYSPDIIAVLDFSREGPRENDGYLWLEYRIRFLGAGIIDRSRRTYPVILIFPSLFCQDNAEVNLWENNILIQKMVNPVKSRHTLWIDIGEDNRDNFRLTCILPQGDISL
jgi:hypothetical protein